jgi:NADP-dependent 3-hydroxy acid dehydrogenase YdfG
MCPSAPSVVVVTGAPAGIDCAIAVALGRRGWSVGLIAQGEERLRRAVEEVQSPGGRALIIRADVADS